VRGRLRLHVLMEQLCCEGDLHDVIHDTEYWTAVCRTSIHI
jgi:hypothetical protein